MVDEVNKKPLVLLILSSNNNGNGVFTCINGKENI